MATVLGLTYSTGGRKEIVFQPNTPSDDIKSAIRDSFSIPAAVTFTLLDEHKRIAVISGSMASGEYLISIAGAPEIGEKLDETQKQLMTNGELYLASDPLLVRDRALVRHKIAHYNATLDANERYLQIKEHIVHPESGPEPHFEPPFFCDYGYLIKVGHSFYANFGCVILDCAPITIGDNVKFGPGVHLIRNSNTIDSGRYAATHPLDAVTRRTVEYAKPISIGNDVWVGGGVRIMPGVKIGDRCVIGAGSVVSKDIPSDSLAVGVPCKVIRKI